MICCLLLQDEECLRPGEATDLSFLEKLEEKVGDHAHFVTYAFMLCILPQRELFPSLTRNRVLGREQFCFVLEKIKQPVCCLPL